MSGFFNEPSFSAIVRNAMLSYSRNLSVGTRDTDKDEFLHRFHLFAPKKITTMLTFKFLCSAHYHHLYVCLEGRKREKELSRGFLPNIKEGKI